LIEAFLICPDLIEAV